MKTGTTRQVRYTEPTRVKHCIYAAGVYHSYNSDDPEQGQPEFYLECEGVTFAANTLEGVMSAWHQYVNDYGWLTPKGLTRLG